MRSSLMCCLGLKKILQLVLKQELTYSTYRGTPTTKADNLHPRATATDSKKQRDEIDEGDIVAGDIFFFKLFQTLAELDRGRLPNRLSKDYVFGFGLRLHIRHESETLKHPRELCVLVPEHNVTI